MMQIKKPLFILLTVFAVCFAFFHFQANWWQATAAAQKEAGIQNAGSQIESAEEEMKNPVANYSNLCAEERKMCGEQIACSKATIDAWNTANWEKRIKNEARYLELELRKEKFGLMLSDKAAMKDTLAFDKALLYWHAKPRDRGEDGMSSVYRLFSDWLLYLLPLCVLLLTSDLISAERSSGSIKLLLQKRKTRTALYMQKFLAGLKWSFLALFSAMLGAFCGGAAVGGTGSLSYPIFFRSSYVQTWKILLLCLPVVLLAVIFYTALGILLSTLFRQRVLSAVGPAAAVFALVFFGRKSVTTAHGNILQVLPFESSDAVTAVFGKYSVPINETFSNPVSGQLISIQSGYSTDISAAMPLWGNILVLTVWSLLLLAAGLLIFRREDLV